MFFVCIVGFVLSEQSTRMAVFQHLPIHNISTTTSSQLKVWHIKVNLASLTPSTIYLDSSDLDTQFIAVYFSSSNWLLLYIGRKRVILITNVIITIVTSSGFHWMHLNYSVPNDMIWYGTSHVYPGTFNASLIKPLIQTGLEGQTSDDYVHVAHTLSPLKPTL